MTAPVPVRSHQGLPIIPQDRWMLRVQAVFGCAAFAAIGVASTIAGGLAAVAGIAYGATLALSSVASFVYNSRFRHRRGETTYAYKRRTCLRCGSDIRWFPLANRPCYACPGCQR